MLKIFCWKKFEIKTKFGSKIGRKKIDFIAISTSTVYKFWFLCKKGLFSSSPPFQIQFWKNYLTLSQGNEIWRGEQIDNSEQIYSSYFTA